MLVSGNFAMLYNVVPESILFCTKSPNLPRVLAFLSKMGYNKNVFFLFGKRIGGNVMLSDIEIAQQAEMQKIREVAAGLSIEEDDLEYYGHYKAKLSESLFQKLEDKPNGKLILVTAINPTPAGEGKTTVSVGLADALRCIGKKSVVALREPSGFRYQGRCCWRRLFAGCSDGGHQLALYRRYARHHRSQ